MKPMTLALLLGAAATLSACGGGGGGSGSSTPATPEGGAVQVPGTLPMLPETPSATTAPVTDVPAPTYAADSAMTGVFNLLNDERGRCGFGKLTQNAQLDVAAGWHTAYLKARWNEGMSEGGHLEDPSRSGWQANTPAERATRAGYSGPVNEYLSYHFTSGADNASTPLVRTLLASVYHRIGMLDGSRDAGISVDYATQSATPLAILTLVTGTQAGALPQDATDVITFPCEGSREVQPYASLENPDPFAGLGLPQGMLVGQPIYVRAPSGKTLRLTGATITNAAGQGVPVTLYHAEQDPQRRLTAWQAFAVPRAKLDEAATYTVQLQGTTNGVAFSRSFSFTTLKS